MQISMNPTLKSAIFVVLAANTLNFFILLLLIYIKQSLIHAEHQEANPDINEQIGPFPIAKDTD